MTDSAELLAFSANYLSRYMLAVVRVLGAVSLNPLFGSARVPLQARIGLGLLVTLVIFPPGSPDDAPVRVGPIELAGELLIGLLAGFAVSLIFAAVSFAGQLIGVNSGFSFASTINPFLDTSSGAVETFFSSLALLVFTQINGHHLFLAGVRDLFQVVEVGHVTQIPGTAERLAVVSAGLFGAGFKMAFPVVAALLLADLALGILARIAPQWNLFSLELPVKMMIGLAALALALPIIIPRLAALFRTIPSGMVDLIG